MPEVYATYDTHCKTWNVIKRSDNTCLFYGSVSEVDEWLEINKHIYREIPA